MNIVKFTGGDIPEPDGSDDDGVNDGYSAGEDVDEDYMTDDGTEQEVEHEQQTLRWKQTDAWRRECRNDPMKNLFGELEWHAPARRTDVKSLETGPEQDCFFDVDVERDSADLLFDALPVRDFFGLLAAQSLAYAKSEARKNRTRRQRHLDLRWFTAANYIRVFAAVLMRGLVNARDDPDFFGGSKHGAFERVGAEKVVGLTLNQYQQLLRYMHLVDNSKIIAPNHDEFDKCFKVRPMITMLQSAFRRWCTPGKNNAMDEATIPSRHKWMRTFNPTKPSKYFMEILMACDSTTRFCWAFFVTESAKKTIRNRHRGGRNKGKFVRVCTHSHSLIP